MPDEFDGTLDMNEAAVMPMHRDKFVCCTAQEADGTCPECGPHRSRGPLRTGEDTPVKKQCGYASEDELEVLCGDPEWCSHCPCYWTSGTECCACGEMNVEDDD
jgi:hypothetical protein